MRSRNLPSLSPTSFQGRSCAVRVNTPRGPVKRTGIARRFSVPKVHPTASLTGRLQHRRFGVNVTPPPKSLISDLDSRTGDAMAYETILLERKGAVAVIRVNRPDKLNAMNTTVKEDISQALGDLERDDGVRVAVITGVGEKAFIAGADINEFAGKKPIDQWQSYGHTSLYSVVDRFPKPIIAMMNGYALGGGCELAMACDIRVASDKAQRGQPEINIGIIPGGGGSQRLPRLVGLVKALQMILTGDRIGAQ